MLDHQRVESILRDMREQINDASRESYVGRGTTQDITLGDFFHEIQREQQARSIISKTIVFVVEHVRGQCAFQNTYDAWSDSFDDVDNVTVVDFSIDISEEINNIMRSKNFFYVPYGQEGPPTHFLNTAHIIQIIPFMEEDYVKQQTAFHSTTSPRLSI